MKANSPTSFYATLIHYSQKKKNVPLVLYDHMKTCNAEGHKLMSVMEKTSYSEEKLKMN